MRLSPSLPNRGSGAGEAGTVGRGISRSVEWPGSRPRPNLRSTGRSKRPSRRLCPLLPNGGSGAGEGGADGRGISRSASGRGRVRVRTTVRTRDRKNRCRRCQNGAAISSRTAKREEKRLMPLGGELIDASIRLLFVRAPSRVRPRDRIDAGGMCQTAAPDFVHGESK